MSIETILFFGAVAMVFPLSKAIERKAARERAERAAQVDKKEMEGTMYREIVWRAYMGLKRQHAVGYGPWLASLIGRIGETPREVTRGVALEALRRTRAELSGSRFDLAVLDSAMAEMGAGE